MARCPDPKMGCFDPGTLGFSVSPDGHGIEIVYIRSDHFILRMHRYTTLKMLAWVMGNTIGYATICENSEYCTSSGPGKISETCGSMILLLPAHLWPAS